MLTTRGGGGNIPVEVTGSGYMDKYEFGNISNLKMNVLLKLRSLFMAGTIMS